MPAELDKSGDERFWPKGRLAGVAEFAKQLGITKSTISRWGNDELLPDPYDTLALGRIWRRWTVERFRDAIEELSEHRPELSDKPNLRLSRIYSAALRKEQKDAAKIVKSNNPGVRSDTRYFDALVRDEYFARIAAAAKRCKEKRDQNGNPSTGTS